MVGIVALKKTSLFGGLEVGEFRAHPTSRMKQEAREKPHIAQMIDYNVYSAIFEAVNGYKPATIEQENDKNDKD